MREMLHLDKDLTGTLADGVEVTYADDGGVVLRRDDDWGYLGPSIGWVAEDGSSRSYSVADIVRAAERRRDEEG